MVRHSKRRFVAAVLAGACVSFLPLTSIAARLGNHGAPLSDEAVRDRADALIAQMTAEEKAGQLSQHFYFQLFPAMTRAARDALEHGQAGALLFVTDPDEINRLQQIAREKSRLKIPVLFGFDVIHGLGPIFPLPLGMAASWDPSLV